MHPGSSSPLPAPGADLGTLELSISAEANDRYWRGAGISHAARHDALLYPPMAANFTMMLIQQSLPMGLLHTWGRLTARSANTAPADVTVSGQVRGRFVKRQRDYFVVASSVSTTEGALWDGEQEFAVARSREDAEDSDAPSRPRYHVPEEGKRARLILTADLLRTYSRAGNFHSDDAAARKMGLPGMTAMGMQTLGPALQLVLDEWGAGWLRSGQMEFAFFGLVLEDDEIEVTVSFEDDTAIFGVRNLTRDRVTAAGTATSAIR